MTNTLTKYEEMINKYAKNDTQVEYIQNLGLDVFEEVYDVIKYMEDNNEAVTYEEILEQSLVYCIHDCDFKTRYKVEKLSKLATYTVLHEVASESDYYLTQDEFGNTKATIKMNNENFVIMSLTGTLDDLKTAIYEQGVATNINITDLEGNKY